MKEIITEIEQHIDSCVGSNGELNDSPIEVIAQLSEILGECAHSANNFHFENNDEKIEHTINQLIKLKRYRHLLLKICSLAIQSVQSVDNNEIEDIHIIQEMKKAG